MVIPRSESCGVAFKEWAGVCQALSDGRQSILIRKGGIREDAGPGVFAPEHAEFWLYPTWTHESEQGLRLEGSGERAVFAGERRADGVVPIRALVRVDQIAVVEDERILVSLERFHCWTHQTILQRFRYRKPGLWVLGARVWLRASPAWVPETPEHAGCKTWVNLNRPVPTIGLTPVVDEIQWNARRDLLKAALNEKN